MMLRKIKDLVRDGVLHIVGASTINKIISLCSGMIIVRLLTQTEYGTYTYVLNIVNIVLLTNGLGTLTGMLQYGCEYSNDKSTQKGIIQYGFKYGLIFNTILSICIIAYGVFFQKSIEGTDGLFVIAAFIPIFNFLKESITSILRINEENKRYGKYTSFDSLLSLSCILLGAYCFGVSGAISFRYIAGFIVIFFGVLYFKNPREIFLKKQNLSDSRIKKSFLKFSIISCANNSISHLFYNADIFIIGFLLASADIIASYKVASTIPLALTFFSAAIITYIYPKFVKNRENYEWLKKHYLILLEVLALCNGIIALLLFIFAPQVIGIVFGKQYVDTSTLLFRILIIGFFISATFRMPVGNLLDMLHLIKPNFYISIVCGIANIVLDVLLIKYLSAPGAAIATSAIYLLYAILSNVVIIRYLKKIK